MLRVLWTRLTKMCYYYNSILVGEQENFCLLFFVFMDIREALGNFRKSVDAEIVEYLDEVIENVKKEDVFMARAVGYAKEFIVSSGKRIRPALMYYGYLGFGGNRKKDMLKTCISLELVHAFLLIHDDIMDRDEKRHGKDTVHFRYSKMGKRLFPKSDSDHFGVSMAISVGDMMAALGSQRIFTSPFPSDVIVRALNELQKVISRTVIGQVGDIYMEFSRRATEEQVLKMYENKTARYTFEGPLHLGAILAGVGTEVLDAVSRYAVPLGTAFQIQDDILGVFGDEKKLGKPVGSDIQEGKMTLLAVHAMRHGSHRDRKSFENFLGKQNITADDMRLVREIFVRTGSAEYAKSQACFLVEQSKAALADIPFKQKNVRDFLEALSDYVAERET